MSSYLLIKYIHILSATFLFGTGIGTAFFMLMAYLSKDASVVKHTTRYVVLADWLFTAPSIIIQPITGVWLMLILKYPFNSCWFLLVMGLYLLAGVCWIPVVVIQYRLRYLAALSQSNLPVGYRRLMRWWIGLGIIAFTSIVIIYWLMLTKWGMWFPIF